MLDKRKQGIQKSVDDEWIEIVEGGGGGELELAPTEEGETVPHWGETTRREQR